MYESEPSNVLTIAFLKCDKLHPSTIPTHGTYEDVLNNLLKPLIATSDTPLLELETLSFDVVHKRQYPTELELRRVDAIIVSGSFEDDANVDQTWILRLAGFLIGVNDRWPGIRIIGICFGLQIIARAFGCAVIHKNNKGWEVGSTKVHLTELGRRLVWAEHASDNLKDLPEFIMTQQIHQDMVHKCPADFELLAWSDLTPIQGICKLYPKDQVIPAFTHSHPRFLAEDPWKHVHIIAFQGHPEWHDHVIVPFINDYEKNGVMNPEFAEAARERTRRPHDGNSLGRALLRVMGITGGRRQSDREDCHTPMP